MSTVRKGPSIHARENLGALYLVTAIEHVDNRRILVLDCPGKHRVQAANSRSEPDPKKGRCKLCPRPICGATSPIGTVCSLRPKHGASTGETLHEHEGRRWSGDARAASEAS